MNLSKLDASLDRILGDGWHNLELETISIQLGALFDRLSVVKIAVLKALQEHPEVILNDSEYFLRFIEVANNNVPDPHHHDLPTGLELAFALEELQKILGKVEVTDCLREVTRYVLNNEGHGEAYCKILSKYSGLPLASSERTRAAEEYIAHMYGSK